MSPDLNSYGKERVVKLLQISIIQRAGVVPMSIAGIAKEVTQISVSAWLFGDELTPLNIVGVGVTVCGKHLIRSVLDVMQLMLSAIDHG